VATAPALCPRVREAGLRAIAAGRNFEDWWPVLAERNPGEPWTRLRPEEILGWFIPRLFAEVGAEAMLEAVVAAVERWQPDLLVHETFEFAGPLVAAAAGIPSVHHTLSPLPGAEVFERVAQVMAPRWRRHGLEPDGFAGLWRGRCLDICPASLRNPHAPPAPALSLRPVVAAIGGETLPPWLAALEGRPIVHLTFGTSVTNADQALLATAVAGVREEPLSLVVTIGHGNDPAGLGPQPDNVRIERYVPHAVLLPRCAAVVSHGGAGTMLNALGCGLPLLTIPQGADQYLNADLCARRGVGRTLRSEDVSLDTVRREVRCLLDDPSFAGAAREVAAEIAAMPTPEQLVAVLESLT
jgi:UDP:flavonoid glycosyltransferase YjiC (YdhE family)